MIDTLQHHGGVAAYTLRYFRLDAIMADMVTLIEKRSLGKESTT
ncbi:MAG: hypothetical protein V6Z81_10960 [Parvularculales bacterium]